LFAVFIACGSSCNAAGGENSDELESLRDCHRAEVPGRVLRHDDSAERDGEF
jgi:hypothetical protein